MLCINNTYTNAYFNLASEEYLLKNSSDDIFMLWQNEPSVIVGKYQNVWAEINMDFVEKNKIKVVRRFSGGGTVFHDSGNLNLTFIENNKNADFDKFTNRIIALLAQLGIHAESDARRAININGLKISGSAQCVHKDRIMFHATLLFSSDLERLTTTLEGDPEQFDNKADGRIYVKSVKSPVTNILQHLNKPIDIEYFKKYIMYYFLNEKQGNMVYNFREEDVTTISELMNNKYSTKEWNFNGRKALVETH
ncbi:lipoate--protein ligase family protein [Dysgonomonas sp. BGC7]|uniref:lipoate--protein ligase family protein n=1 Tax=Dysgonomonas sp. BGC7 TaxID=1658008 RepID=UPI000682E7B8|nr:lipoate--protein ligase family protein [Dysgonomonas sp. BGC7]MBD8390140.1 lipoate--protein ligase family protein [Dysgonomonas sp. BGC7]